MKPLQFGNYTLSTNLMLCPIAGYCDLPFRLTIRPLGGLAMASTDLVNPRGLLRQTPSSMHLVETDPADQPLCLQLYGSEPPEMAAAAQWGEANGATIIDINMGCPVDKVTKKNGGSALMRQCPLALELAGAVVNAVKIPVTAKMRLGWDEDSINAPELAVQLEDVGIAAITVHGRTAVQKFSGNCNQDGIARVVEAVKRVPVIGNGDVRTPQDAKGMIDYTGCAGVMIGRAALADPWLFRDTHAYLTTGDVPIPPSVADRLALIRTHFGHMVRQRGENSACMAFRQRISWYVKHIRGSKAFREEMRSVESVTHFDEIIGRFGDECAEREAVEV